MLQYQICKYIIKSKNLFNHIHPYTFIPIQNASKKLNSLTAKNRTNKRNPTIGQFDTMDDDEYNDYSEESSDGDCKLCKLKIDDITRTDCCMRRILSLQEDFISQKSLLQEEIEKRGHKCIFYPKYHCELNFIEMC